MKDFLNNKLSVGDMVVFLHHERTSSHLRLGKIVKLTDKMVTAETSYEDNYKRVWRFSPYKAVRVSERERGKNDLEADI